MKLRILNINRYITFSRYAKNGECARMDSDKFCTNVSSEVNYFLNSLNNCFLNCGNMKDV